MSQQQDATPFVGFAILFVAAIFFSIIIAIIGSIFFIGFAIFGAIVANKRYRKIGGIAALLSCFTLTPAVFLFFGQFVDHTKHADAIVMAGRVAVGMSGIAMPAIGFIGACIVLDFLNGQRGLPVWHDDFVTWRRRNGFTKGLPPEETSPPTPIEQQANAFDVPPQDRL